MLYLRDTPGTFLSPSVHVRPPGNSCLSGFASFERWHGAAGKAGRQEAHAIGQGDLLAVLQLTDKCLVSHLEGIYVYVYLSVRVLSALVSGRSGQASRMRIWSSITTS